MKKIISFAIVILLFSCKNVIKTESNEDFLMSENIRFDVPNVNSNLTITTKEDLLGYWVGQSVVDDKKALKKIILEEDEFSTNDYEYSKKITFSIDKISGSEIMGHSIIGGNIKKFKGKLTETSLGFEINTQELANKKLVGDFSLIIKLKDSLLIGTNILYNKEGNVDSKYKLKLTKKIFTYNQNNNVERHYVDFQKSIIKKIEYEAEDSIGNPIKEVYDDEQFYTTTDTLYSINPSTELLKKELVENLSKGDVFILRNLIFARHGYVFKDKTLRRFFDFHSWYMPVFFDVNKDLTKIEKKNVALLLRYEQNAKEYYQHFGR
ncbi:MAG: YARHG domain-containing protein [Bacteroidota bacterium]